MICLNIDLPNSMLSECPCGRSTDVVGLAEQGEPHNHPLTFSITEMGHFSHRLACVGSNALGHSLVRMSYTREGSAKSSAINVPRGKLVRTLALLAGIWSVGLGRQIPSISPGSCPLVEVSLNSFT